MFVLPFLSSPASYALQAYKNLCVEVPIVEQTWLGSRKVEKGSQKYAEIVKNLPGYKIKEELQTFLDRMNIRKDLIVTEHFNLCFCSAVGTNFSRRGDAAIYVAPRFHQTDKEACHWLMKHEISHIKNNDAFTVLFIPAICSLAMATFATFTLPVIPALILTLSVGYIAHIVFTRYREGKADDFAIAESSVEELKGGRRWLIASQQINLENRKGLQQKIFISSSGEDRRDLFHPSNASRLKKIERALQQKKGQINEAEEVAKIAILKDLILQNNSEVIQQLEAIGNFALFKSAVHL